MEAAFLVLLCSLRIFCLNFNSECMEIWNCLKRIFKATVICDLKRSCKQWGEAVNTNEPSLTSPSLTSWCVVWFLTGHRPTLVCDQATGDLWSRGLMQKRKEWLHSRTFYYQKWARGKNTSKGNRNKIKWGWYSGNRVKKALHEGRGHQQLEVLVKGRQRCKLGQDHAPRQLSLWQWWPGQEWPLGNHENKRK